MDIYVASSWRNEHQPGVVAGLRDAGLSVYDFRNPAAGNRGFHWSEIDPNWKDWSTAEYRHALRHPLAEQGYGFDMSALLQCRVCVLVLPCGRSAHLEAGFAAGAGKAVAIYQPESVEPELMNKMCRLGVHESLDAVVEVTRDWLAGPR